MQRSSNPKRHRDSFSQDYQFDMSGAQLFIHLLKMNGVDTIFGIPGGSILPIYDALYASDINHVLAKHEQGAGFMAQGMARTTGKPAVCMVTSGPGAVNLLTAISDAYSDSVPVIAISGQVVNSLRGTSAFQEVDIVSMAQGITKQCFYVNDINDLPRVINEAFRLAVEGRPGPVWIDIPKDVQLARFNGHISTNIIEEELITDFSAEIFQLNELIRESLSPVIIGGHGILLSDATTEFQSLIEHFNIPVVNTLLGLGSLPAQHPLNMGMAGMHGLKRANETLINADLVIVLGSRLDDRLTGNLSEFCPNAKMVHIDINSYELNRIRQVDLAIQADLKTFINQWMHYSCCFNRASNICQSINELDAPHAWLKDFACLLPEDIIVTTDVGQHQMWVAQSFPLSNPRSFLTSGGQGTMGFGLPAAIGAAIANPKRKVICFSGDGSLLMNIQELATLAELNLNITIVLMNNSGLGMVRQQQELFYNQRFSASNYASAFDFTSIAKAFGIMAIDATMDKDSLSFLNNSLNESSPLLINLKVDSQQMFSPMMIPGKSIGDMLDCRCQSQLVE